MCPNSRNENMKEYNKHNVIRHILHQISGPTVNRGFVVREENNEMFIQAVKHRVTSVCPLRVEYDIDCKQITSFDMTKMKFIKLTNQGWQIDN